MTSAGTWMDMLREWEGHEHFHILLIVAAAVAIYQIVRRLVPFITSRVRPHSRFYLLPWVPLLRLAIILTATGLIVPLVIIPTRENVLILLGAVALALGFVLKDYVSCFFAGFVLLAERAYRVGDWVQIGSTYGEVVELGLRTVKLRTADANDVSIPHSLLWDKPLINATGGSKHILCAVHFFVRPDPCCTNVREALLAVAGASAYLLEGRPVVVVVKNEPFGLHYKVKAYAQDARDQFLFVADITERGNLALHGLGLTLVTASLSVAAND